MVERLHTSGRYIQDSLGRTVRLQGASVSWRFRYASHYYDYDPLAYNDEINESSMNLFTSTPANFIRLCLNAWTWYVKRAPKYIAAVDTVISWCKARGIMVVLSNMTPWLDADTSTVYKDRITLATEMADWKNWMVELAERYKNEPTVIGFDMMNEPRYVSDWVARGYSDPWSIWRTNVLDVIRAIHAVNAGYLCFVEPLGSSAHEDDMHNFKINPLPEPNIVYCAHIYYAWDLAPPVPYAENYAAGNFDLAKQQMEASYYQRFIDMVDVGLPVMQMETAVYGHARENENPNWQKWLHDSGSLYTKYGVSVNYHTFDPDRADSSLFSLLNPDRVSLTETGRIWLESMLEPTPIPPIQPLPIALGAISLGTAGYFLGGNLGASVGATGGALIGAAAPKIVSALKVSSLRIRACASCGKRYTVSSLRETTWCPRCGAESKSY